MKRALLLSTMILATACGWAQEMTLEVPAEITALNWMDGVWEGKMDMSIQGMDMTQVGTMTISTDGMFKKIVSLSEVMGIKMVETSYLGWDASTKKYTMYTFTNWVPTPRIERGTMDASKAVFISDPWLVEGMEPTTSRITMDYPDKKTIKMTMEFKEGDKWSPVGSGSYTKK